MRSILTDAIALRDAKVLVLLPSVIAGFAIFLLLNKGTLLAAGALVVLGVLGLMIRWPEVGTPVVLFCIYSNVSVLAMRSETAIQVAAGPAGQNPKVVIVLAALSLLLCVPLIHQLLVRKEKFIFDRGLILMLAFFAALLASSWFARDGKLAASQVTDYLLEGVALYFLATNVIRDFSTLRRATWSLLLAGSLMAGLSVFQKATHTEDKIYGGLAQMGVDITLDASGQERELRPSGAKADVREPGGQQRAAGPIGEPNRYAQILVVLLPLAALTFRTERLRTLRTIGLVAGAIILGGLLLTYSRASLLVGVVLLGMMAYLGLLKTRHVLVSAIGVSVLVVVFAPGVIGRLATLEDLKSLVFHTGYTYRAPDSSALHRYALDYATWHVFLNHPVFGVGPGHFAEYYAIPYSNRAGLIETTKKYKGHNMYLETLAETGVIGFACLVAIGFEIMRGLWKERRRLAQSHPEYASWATAFFLCLCGYAMSAAFAHLSYQRYFWLLVAMCSAAVRILHSKQHEPGVSEGF